jgi:hypothetical protein
VRRRARAAAAPSTATSATVSAAQPDVPAYYLRGGLECNAVIRAVIGDAAFVDHCRASALAYVWRAGEKGPATTAEDLRKAATYLTRAADVMDEGQDVLGVRTTEANQAYRAALRDLGVAP